MISRYIFIVCLVFSINYAWAQDKEPTDEELGFDREAIKKEMYESNTFINKDFLDAQIDKLREDAVLRYKLGATKWFIQTQAKSSKEQKTTKLSSARVIANCSNATFDASLANPLASGWDLIFNIPPYQYSDNSITTVSNATGDTYQYTGGETRYAVNTSFTDPYFNNVDDPGVAPTTKYLKIGSSTAGNRREKISRTFILNDVDEFIFYRFAVVLQDPGHTNRPYFAISMKINDELEPCSLVMYEAPQYGSATVPGFEYTTGGVFVRPWSSNFIKPADLGANVNDVITIEVSVSDCGMGGHFGYGYFDMECIDEDQIILASSDTVCPGQTVQFMSGVELIGEGYSWTVRNSLNAVVAGPFYTPYADFTPTALGTYTVSLTVPYFTTSTEDCNVESLFEKTISVTECPPVPCDDCTSFSLIKNEKYIISGWVKEKTSNDEDVQVRTYQNSYISLSFYDPNAILIGSLSNFLPTGEVIDGWQRISGEFTVPNTVEKMHISLKNNSNANIAYFDDIRVNPIKGNLKSYVYDQESQKLMAELDENNYSTFYEYDKEGGLVRVKKETEKGIYTIQETRSGNSKTENDGN